MFVRTTIAALALLGTAAPLLAQESDPFKITIKVSDLDLTQAADRERFELRAKSAARSACRSGLGGTQARAIEQHCMEEVIANAQAQVEE